MSKANPAPERMTVNWLPLAQAAEYRAAIAANAVASAILGRAARQAHRELAAMGDRTLADIGLARPELASLLEVLAEARTTAVLSQLPWNRPRRGA
jgi:uncharacterized protein YjiS (DUF1127 family)